MRKIEIKVLSVVLAAVLLLCACNPEVVENDGPVTITIAASKNVQSAIESLVNGFNSSGEYSSKYVLKATFYDSAELLYYYFEHGAIDPDIVIFENINSANAYSEYLQPLNRFESTSKYQVSILNSLKTVDGDLFGLPAPGSIYMQAFNADMFSTKIHIDSDGYPQTLGGLSDGSGDLGMTNIAKLVGDSASRNSLVSYASEAGDLSLVYTLMEVAVPLFASSTAGIDFVKKYYEGDARIGDSAYIDNWKEILETYRTYYSFGYYSLDNETLSSGEATQMFVDGEVFVYTTVPGSDMESAFKEAGGQFNVVFYPFVGETANQKWIISKPYFYVGVSKKAYNDANRGTSAGITAFLEYFSSGEGRTKAAESDNEIIRYTTDSSTANLPGIFQYLNDPINQNKIYLCDLFVTVFSAATDVLRSYASGEITLDETIALLDEAVAEAAPGKETPSVSNDEFDYTDGGLTDETAIGNLVADALRKTASTQAVVVPAELINCNIFKGELDSKCLAVVFDDEISLTSVRMSVAGLKQLLADCAQDGVFPLISGLKLGGSGSELTISQNGKVLDDSGTLMILLTEEWAEKYSDCIVSSGGIYYTTLELFTRYLELSEVNGTLTKPALDGRYGDYTVQKN